MSAVAYLNGDFVAENDARVSIFDRGFLFGDAVYEVVPVIRGRPVNRAAHMQRLARSLGELQLTPPLPPADIDALIGQMIARNRIDEGRVYLQISRGPAERDFCFPERPRPTLMMFARSAPLIDNPAARSGIRVCTVNDQRWTRRDIKTVMLLPSSMAKQQAKRRGFDDAWMVQEGLVTEGSSNNAYIVKDGIVFTRPLSNDILGGCTRRALLALAGETGTEIREQAFTVEQAHAADEAFVTSATTLVLPVIQIDDSVLGDGAPGPLARKLRRIYIAAAVDDSADAVANAPEPR